MRLKTYELKDCIKSLNINGIEHYYIGLNNKKKNNSLGVYFKQILKKEYTINGEKIPFEIAQYELLIHGNEYKNQTEDLANVIYDELDDLIKEIRRIYNTTDDVYMMGSCEITNAELGMFVDLDCDENGIWEYGIFIDIAYDTGADIN